jgi:hypothetical protein
MLLGIIAILAGFVLLAEVLRSSSNAARFARMLLPFETVIGIAALIVGLLNLFGFTLLAVLTLLGGLVLGAQAVRGLPGFGPALSQAGKALAGIGAVLGGLLVAVGLYHLITVALR